MFDFASKLQDVFLNRDYNIRVSWWLNEKYVIGVRALYWTYASLRMVQNEPKNVADSTI
jgi:hypothetical protein